MCNKLRNRKFSILMVPILIGLILIPAIFVYGQTSATLSSSEEAIQVASNIAHVAEDTNLLSIKSEYDSYWSKDLWTVEWITPEHELIIVQLDKSNLELCLYLDTTKEVTVDDTRVGSESIDAAWILTLAFIELMKEKGHELVPQGAVFSDIHLEQRGWVSTWIHIVDDMKVEGDFVTITTDKNTEAVYSYSKCWHNVGEVTPSRLDNNDAIECAKLLFPSIDFTSTTPELKLFRTSGLYRPAWLFDTGYDRIWISAINGQLIHFDTTLYDPLPEPKPDPIPEPEPDPEPDPVTSGYNKDVFVRDDGVQMSYDFAETIYHRFKYSTTFPSGYSARYYTDYSRNREPDLFPESEVLFQIGHGSGFEVSPGVYHTGIGEYGCSDPILPSEIPSLTTMDLAWINTCWSFASSWKDKDTGIWHTISKSICRGFYDKGAKCVFGWTSTAVKGWSQEFSAYFFDKAVSNQYSFASCLSWARAKVPDISAISKMIGDSSLHMNEKDAGGDYMTGAKYLGSGKTGNYVVNDEGIWLADEDWYTFTIEDWSSVTISVIDCENNNQLNQKFQVYDRWGGLLANGESGCSFSFSGKVYLRIISVFNDQSTTIPPKHGGGYDLTIVHN